LRSNPHPKGDTFDVELQVVYKPKNSTEKTISTSNLKYMYWTFKQQLAHHTVNGCNMKTGDLCGSGTISGPVSDAFTNSIDGRLLWLSVGINLEWYQAPSI
jgi:fumarylacetoacetase